MFNNNDKNNPKWNDWLWQLQKRITDIDTADSIFHLTDEEKQAFGQDFGCHTPFSVTPYYANVIKDSVLRGTIIPSLKEWNFDTRESTDPLGEEDCSPFPNLVHKYKDRVLFLVSNFCPAYCRYCTRGRRVGKPEFCHYNNWDKVLEYIAQHKEINMVILSGGDPLILSDKKLDTLLAKIHRIPHIETIRIGTKAVVDLPMRITQSLVDILKKYPPIYIAIHFTHPDEITSEVIKACNLLADNGIQLCSQTVLLKGINDDSTTLVRLMKSLLKNRVRPYYLFQCDALLGISHFRVKVEKGLQILDEMKKEVTGMCIPQYAIDFPNRTGKIALVPNRLEGFTDNTVLLKNFNGEVFEYPN